MSDTVIPADWVTGIKDGYYTKEMQIGNCKVTVHRPILDEKERAKAEAKVIEALKGFLKKGI